MTRVLRDQHPLSGGLRLLAVAAAFFIGIAGTSKGDEIGAGASDAELVRAFDTVALRNEMVTVPPRITKWTRGLKIYISEELALTADERRGLYAHLRRLSEITGLQMRFVDEERRSNYRIYFTSRAAFGDHMERNIGSGQSHLLPRLNRSVCAAFHRSTASRREILKAVIVIPVDSARASDMLRACMVEETTQMLGLPNDSDGLAFSIFNDSNSQVELTIADEYLLRILYHPRIAVGMDRQAALQIARQVLPLVRAEAAGQTAIAEAQ